MELADADSISEVHQVVDSLIQRRLPVDRIAIAGIDEPTGIITINHVTGTTVRGFDVGDSFEITGDWQRWIRHHRSETGDLNYRLPLDQTSNWKDGKFQSVIRVPLRTRDQVTGYLALSAYRANAFNEADKHFLMAVAQNAAPHLRAASLLEESIKEAGLRRALSEVARAMSMSADLATLYEIAGIQMEALIGFDYGFVAEAQPGVDTLAVKHQFGRQIADIRNNTEFRWDPDFAHLDDTVRYWDLDTLEIGDGAYPFSLLADEGFRSVAMVTLMTEGEPIGWLVLASSTDSLDAEYTSQLMQGIGSHLANAIIKGRAEAEQARLLQRLAVQNSDLRATRTLLQASEDEIKKQNAELQRANEAKNTFLSAVSHELKTPLAIMIGFAELLGLNATGNLEDSQLEQLSIVERNGRQLDLLVADLVDVNRIESGHLAVNLEPLQPGEVLAETLAGLDTIAVEKQQRIVREIDVAKHWMRADRARLGQIVTNLVTNACKYSPAESEVIVQASIESNELVIVVKDSGLGISKADQSKLFTPFFRSSNEEAKKEKGTGLGLMITRSIVEMHGGTLQLESELGEGTVITVRIPGVVDEEVGDRGPNDAATKLSNVEAVDSTDAA
jgi:signal transduction histidine kinase